MSDRNVYPARLIYRRLDSDILEVLPKAARRRDTAEFEPMHAPHMCLPLSDVPTAMLSCGAIPNRRLHTHSLG